MGSKDDQLGMPYGTACHRLRKMILFDLLEKRGENVCYRCGKLIDTYDELSVEHKKAWLNVNPELFWDLDNIAFSHLRCNSGNHKSKKRTLVHGTTTGYRYGCRCNECIAITREDTRERVRKGRTRNKNYGR